MSPELVLWVKLSFVEEKRAEFEAYERLAAAILGDYGATISLAFRPEGEPDVEWHMVRFPNAAAFQAYRQDEHVAVLKPQRDAVIVNTEIIMGTMQENPYR